MLNEQLTIASKILKKGGVIAYPTESCYGLGCNPKNYHAVKRILKIKTRRSSSGFIIIANNLPQLSPYIKRLSANDENKIQNTWPGPITWLLEASEGVPNWLKGNSDKIALRIPSHRISRHLCKLAGMPIVSTSANRRGRRAKKSISQFNTDLSNCVDYIIDAPIGKQKKPSSIVDNVTGEVIR